MAEREDAKELHIRPRGVHSPKPIDGSRLQPPTGGSGLAPTVPRPGSVEGPKLVVEELNELHAEADRLRSRVAELDELSDNRRHKIKQMAAVLGGLRQENAGLRAEKSEFMKIVKERDDLIDFRQTLRWQLKTVSDENAGLRETLVEERAKAEFLASKYHKDYEFFTYVWDRADGETAIQKAVALDKARAALGNHPETPDSSANPSETPISSGMRRDDE